MSCVVVVKHASNRVALSPTGVEYVAMAEGRTS